MTAKATHSKCFRCKALKVIGTEIASTDLRAVCHACLSGRTTQEATTVNVPAQPRQGKLVYPRRHGEDRRE